MVQELRRLAVSAEMDASKYAAGAKTVETASNTAGTAVRGLGASVQQTDQKISQSGDVLARLSRQYVDGYASAQRMNSAVNALSRGLDSGKITMSQAIPILDGIHRKYGMMADGAQFAAKGQLEFAQAVSNTSARLTAQAAAAANAAAEAKRLEQAQATTSRGFLAGNDNRFAALNSSQQFQDIIVSAQMGQSLTTIGLQQGLQLGSALSMQLGESGAAGAARTLLGGLTALISPINLIAIGGTMAAAAMIQWFISGTAGAKKLDDALEEQRKTIVSLGEAYGVAGLKADDFARKSVIAAESAARRSTAELRKSAAAADKEVQEQLGSRFTIGRGRDTHFAANPEFREFGAAIAILNGQIERGVPNYRQFEKSISGVVANNPGLQATADKILGIVAAASAAADQLGKTNEILKDMNRSSVGGPAALDRAQQAGRDEYERQRRMGNDPFARFNAAQEEADAARRRQAAQAQLQGLLARSPAEKAEAARAAAAAQYMTTESAAARADRIDIAGKLALAEAEKGLADARKERARSLEGTMAQQQLEIALIGKTVGEAERLRMEYELTSDLRQEAARNGVAADEKEIELIKKKAAEYGRFAEMIAKATLARELQFEREQMLRSPGDQAIAARQRSSGLAVDLNSSEAQQMREMQRISDLRDGIRGFFDDFRDGLMQGDSIGKALSNAILNALNRGLDKILDNLFNQIATTLAGSVSGGGASGGIFGAVLGALGLGGGARSGGTSGSDPWGALREVTSASNVTRMLSPANSNVAGDMAGYIQQAAVARGIDAGIALQVARSEGLAPGVWQSNLFKNGIREPSYGPFQLLKGGAGTGFPTGLGNDFMRQTGLDPANPANARAGVDFALDHAAKNGWGAWYGAKAAGIGNRQGLDGAAPLGASASKATAELDKFSTSATSAAGGIGRLGSAGANATQGLQQAAGGLSGVAKQLQSFMASAQGGGSSWFQNLAGMFGGAGGAFSFMSGISPLATADILSGSWGLFHEGGVAGYATSFRSGVDPRVFAGAPRYHNGGIAGDEVPAILRRGEPVFKSFEHARQVVGGGVNINISNNAGVEIQAKHRKNDDGTTTVDVVIDRMVADKLATRGTAANNTIRGQFGASQALKRR
ncbi:MAG: phage tail length tape measure family protein [Proteobacteria bacterium]|nr:phage tail length tape measure family protein [Pseudomonadota bacterium]